MLHESFADRCPNNVLESTLDSPRHVHLRKHDGIAGSEDISNAQESATDMPRRTSKYNTHVFAQGCCRGKLHLESSGYQEKPQFGRFGYHRSCQHRRLFLKDEAVDEAPTPNSCRTSGKIIQKKMKPVHVRRGGNTVGRRNKT